MIYKNVHDLLNAELFMIIVTSDWNACLHRSCPECRVMSNFIVPSRYWVEDEESKNRLIAAYQSELR